jgi:hypothetical protein
MSLSVAGVCLLNNSRICLVAEFAKALLLMFVAHLTLPSAFPQAAAATALKEWLV